MGASYPSRRNGLPSNVLSFKLQTIIDGDVSYSAFPSPALIVNNVKIDFRNINSSKIIIKKMIIKTAYNKISKINELDFKKFILRNGFKTRV